MSVWQYGLPVCPVSKNKPSLYVPITPPRLFVSAPYHSESLFHGWLYLHPSLVLIPLCSPSPGLPDSAPGIDRVVPQCRIWNRGSLKYLTSHFLWPIIPFPTGLKGPSVIDNLPLSERESVLSTLPLSITCFFVFLKSSVLTIPFFNPLCLSSSPSHSQ